MVVARNLDGVALREIVLVGPRKWLGEVIKLEGGNATIQVYENTCTSDLLPPPPQMDGSSSFNSFKRD